MCELCVPCSVCARAPRPYSECMAARRARAHAVRKCQWQAVCVSLWVRQLPLVGPTFIKLPAAHAPGGGGRLTGPRASTSSILTSRGRRAGQRLRRAAAAARGAWGQSSRDRWRERHSFDCQLMSTLIALARSMFARSAITCHATVLCLSSAANAPLLGAAPAQGLARTVRPDALLSNSAAGSSCAQNSLYSGSGPLYVDDNLGMHPCC